MYYPFYPEANMGTEKHIVMGVFEHQDQLTRVLKQLEDSGYQEDSISVVTSDESRNQNLSIEHHTKAAEGAAGGGLVGGLAGAVMAGLMSAGIITTGGMNLVVAGPIVSTLAGFGAGSAAGGLIGALIGAGIPEHDIEFFKKKLHSGHFLIAVETKGPTEAEQVYEIFNAEDPLSTDERWETSFSNSAAG